VPRADEEDARQAVRELDVWKSERKRVVNRMRGLLATQGITGPIGASFAARLPALRVADSDGPLGVHLQARLQREWAHLVFVRATIRRLEQERRARLQTEREERGIAVARQLMRLAGIAEQGATVLSAELFSWRAFRSGRELGGFLGLTGTPYDSGGRRREQGISKAGSPRLRQLLVQLAWVWRRCQRDSALTQWYERRFGGSPRQRRIGIVALARRLAIALWRFVEWGEVPEGAHLSLTSTAA
jgi:transposase